MMHPHIDCQFDGGNIVVRDASDPAMVRLSLRKDTASDHSQWFYFSITGKVGTTSQLRIEDVDTASYPEAWPGSQAVVSDDQDSWRRTKTVYEGGALVITLTFTAARMYVAYFAPYSQERKDACVARALITERFGHQVLGRSLDGRPIECLTFGETPETAPPVWIIARQHPGETMASWWMEGALDLLSDPSDPIANAIERDLSLFIVPMMNPDGAFRGHLRTNMAGADLNRAWAEPSMETSPEVYVVRQKMDETSVRLFMDVHGDEEMPHNFIIGTESAAKATKDSIAETDRFKALLAGLSPDFQTKFGYDQNDAGIGSTAIANNHVFERYGALAMTLEMPFKDTLETPDETFGWSPARSKHLARSCLQAIWMHLFSE